MDIFDNLPYDLQIKVYNNIRFPQSKKLLYDIECYFKIKKLIYAKYLRRGLMYSDDYFDDLNIHAWIDYDLIIFRDNNKGLNKKVIDKNDERLKHFLSYKTISKNNNDNTIYTFRKNLNISCIYRINRNLSILTTQERLDFLND
jgi:hypothetical protein